MKIETKSTLYEIKTTQEFRKQLKKLNKQGKDLDKLKEVILKLGNNEKLDDKYRNHYLVNNKYYKNCQECHIEPDWLLIYKIENKELIIILLSTGSHSELFSK